MDGSTSSLSNQLAKKVESSDGSVYALTLTSVPKDFNNPEFKSAFSIYTTKKCLICYRPQHMGWGVAFFDDMDSMLRAYTEMPALLPRPIKVRISSDSDLIRISNKKASAGKREAIVKQKAPVPIKSHDEVLKILFSERDKHLMRSEYVELEQFLISMSGDISKHTFCLLNFSLAYEYELDGQKMPVPCEVSMVQFTLIKRETNTLSSPIYPFVKHHDELITETVMTQYRQRQKDIHGLEDSLLQRFHDYGALWRDICSFASTSGILLLSRAENLIQNQKMLEWLNDQTDYDNPFLHCSIQDLFVILKSFACAEADISKYLNAPVISGGKCYCHSDMDTTNMHENLGLWQYCSLAQCKYDCRAIYKFAKDINFSPQLEGQSNINMNAYIPDETNYVQSHFWQPGGKR